MNRGATASGRGDIEPDALTGAVLAVVICAPIGTVTLHRIADRMLPGARASPR